MGRGGLTPPPLQTAPGCGGQWCWSVFFSLPSSQRERKRSHQREKSLARNHQSQELRVNVTWAHQNLLSQTPRSTLALENAPVGGTSRGTTARGATRTVGSVSRTRSLDRTRRREAAAKQGRTRSTARPSKEIASTSATVIQTPLARRRPTWASLDSTGSASATRDTLEMESNAWTAMATSVPNLANKLR